MNIIEIRPDNRPDLFFLESSPGTFNLHLKYGIELVRGINVHVVFLPGRDYQDRPTIVKVLFTENPSVWVKNVDTGLFTIEFKEVRFDTKYIRAIGPPTQRQSQWFKHITTLNTTLMVGETDLLMGWARKIESDGSLIFRKTYATQEAGISEILTETWKFPNTLHSQPKISLVVTSNRGIVRVGSIDEGTFRAFWRMDVPGHGRSDADVRQGPPGRDHPARHIHFDRNNGRSKIDWKDFPYSNEVKTVLTPHKADILFFRNGATPTLHGSTWRTIDPTLTTATTASTITITNYSHAGNPASGTEWRMVFNTSVGGGVSELMIGDIINRVGSFNAFDFQLSDSIGSVSMANATGIILTLPINSPIMVKVSSNGTVATINSTATYSTDCYLWASGDLYIVTTVTDTVGYFTTKYCVIPALLMNIYNPASLDTLDGNHGIMTGNATHLTDPALIFTTQVNVGTEYIATDDGVSQVVYHGQGGTALFTYTWRNRVYLLAGAAPTQNDALKLTHDYRKPYLNVITGTLVTTDPGNELGDGYNETRGHYVVQAASNQIEVKFDPSGGTRASDNYFRTGLKITNWTSSASILVDETMNDGAEWFRRVSGIDYNITTLANEGQVGAQIRLLQILSTLNSTRRWRINMPTVRQADIKTQIMATGLYRNKVTATPVRMTSINSVPLFKVKVFAEKGI